MLMKTSLSVSAATSLRRAVDLGAALADQDPGARGVDVDRHLVGAALDHDPADAGVEDLLLDELPDLQVLVQEHVGAKPRSANQFDCQPLMTPSRNP